MAKKKKRFIDKNNSITFKLVGRSQNDPLFVDETAPQYVLVEKKTKQVILDEDDYRNGRNDSQNQKSSDHKKRREEQIKYGIYFDDDYDYLQHLADVNEISIPGGIDLETMKESQVKDNKPSLMLPSSVFESTVQEKEDLIKKAALPVGPQLDWDPDIVEAMDDDFDFDDPNNQLNDDFVIQAMKPTIDSYSDSIDISDTFIDYKRDFLCGQEKTSDSIHRIEKEPEESDDNLSMCGYNGSADEDDEDDEQVCDQFNLIDNLNNVKLMSKKNVKRFFGMMDNDNHTIKTSASSTHFTEYSMSSSVLPRNVNLKTLDEKFEHMFIREYADDMAIGALESEEINGEIDPNHSEMMNKLVQEYQNCKSAIRQEYERNESSINYVRKYLEQMKINEDGLDDDEQEQSCESEKEEIRIVDSGRKGDKNRFDCESILSTYSNTQYHPKVLNDVIDRYGNPSACRRNHHIQLDPNTGIPIFSSSSGLCARDLVNLNSKKNKNQMETKSTRSNMSRLSELSIRPKDETSEERKQRKKELREFRAQRRSEKKANRLAFNNEKIRLHKAEMNKTVQKKAFVI